MALYVPKEIDDFCISCFLCIRSMRFDKSLKSPIQNRRIKTHHLYDTRSADVIGPLNSRNLPTYILAVIDNHTSLKIYHHSKLYVVYRIRRKICVPTTHPNFCIIFWKLSKTKRNKSYQPCSTCSLQHAIQRIETSSGIPWALFCILLSAFIRSNIARRPYRPQNQHDEELCSRKCLDRWFFICFSMRSFSSN